MSPHQRAGHRHRKDVPQAPCTDMRQHCPAAYRCQAPSRAHTRVIPQRLPYMKQCTRIPAYHGENMQPPCRGYPQALWLGAPEQCTHRAFSLFPACSGKGPQAGSRCRGAMASLGEPNSTGARKDRMGHRGTPPSFFRSPGKAQPSSEDSREGNKIAYLRPGARSGLAGTLLHSPASPGPLWPHPSHG